MTQFHYPLPEFEPQSPLSGLSDETRTALPNIAMGPSAAKLLLNPNGQPSLELDPDFQPIVEASFQRSTDLFGALLEDGLRVPELTSPELSVVNWQHLQEGFRAYEALNMQP